MAASMKGIDPRLKYYLREHKLPDIYEALLTGLAVMCPDDPLQFLLDKLGYLKECGTGKLNWDLFVAEHMKPVRKIITESNLDFIFNMDDESFIDYSDIPVNIQKGEGHFGGRFKGLAANDKVWPTPQMYAAAYEHYNKSLKSMCFSAWMQYYLHKRNKKLAMKKKMMLAKQHHAHRLMRVHLEEWMEWVNYRKGCQAMAYQKIQKVYHVVIGHIYFSEWRTTTKVAKQQREYFEMTLRLERGERMKGDDGAEEGVGDACDHITLMANREVAAVIFSYVDIADLARCACVCRSWKVIMQASSLWSRLDFYKVKHRLSSGVTDKVTTKLMAKCRPYLIHLNLRGCPLISEPTFTTISECRNLQDVNFSECKGLNDETLKTVVKGCKILLYLNVSHTGITDSGLRTISKYCQNVQYLSVAFCKRFSDRGLSYLATGKNNKKLEYVDMSGCLQITPLGFKNFANGCVNVQQLYLNEFPTLNDECMLAIAEKCTNLHTVSLLGSPLLTDESFKKLAHNKKLKKVRVEGNHRISDAAMKAIGKCSNLEHIYVADCERLTDASMKQIASCKKLRVVNFADVVRITDSGVKSLIDGCAATLQELNLTNCIRVGDMSMFNINKKCSNLTYLSVCFCEHITEAGIDLLGQIHSLTSLDISGCNCGDNGLSALGNNIRLRDVTLSECTSITDLGLQKFTQQCKELERLDLSHCMLITDGAIKNLAFCCRNLNVLNLAGCKLLTDSSVQYLSGVCHYLTWLDLSGCYLVTNKALSYLKKGCKKMNTLIIKYCKGIQKPAAQKIMKHIRNVEYNNDEVPYYFGYY